jgi:DNA-binding NtrC family response regulator
LETGATVVGREPDSDGFLVDHETVSRRHLLVRWDEASGQHTAADLGSHNGSFVDGVAFPAGTAVPLRDGSVLRIGDALLVYERGPGLDGAEAADAGVSREAAPGEGPAMCRFRARLARAAADASTVLIIGETGTGKERIAAEVHRLGGRPGPLIPLNCAALSPQLVESQLFGHTKGAFTGASAAQEGLFRAAEGGTLFLDEVGELPLELQPKLLRAIEQREVQPVGMVHPVRVDVRVVAATNRDLAAASASGAFRPDLYARLSTWELRLPPLRERRADLFSWFDLFHRRWAAERGGGAAPELTPEAAEALLLCPWPLNLRGLERLVHELGALVRAGGATGTEARALPRSALPPWLLVAPEIGEGRPPLPPGAGGAERGGRRDASHDQAKIRRPSPSREEFIAVYQQWGGSVRAVAKHFRRDRRQIYRWLASYGVR